MYSNDDDFDIAEFNPETNQWLGVRESVSEAELSHFQNEYRTSEFEAMTEVPSALAAFVSHQYLSEL